MKRVIGLVAIVVYALLPFVSTFFSEEAKDNVYTSVKDIDKSYDVIVVGGEPEGVAAAVSSARSGNKTLLIEHRDGLGGLMTYGMLNFLDISNDQHGDIANAGIFKEWHKMVGGQVGFDINEAKDAFMQLVKAEENLTLVLETDFSEVVMEGNRLTALKLVDESDHSETIEAKRFIDSTQDADLAVKAGAPYFIGGEDIGLDRKMAVTLMIHLDNVDWKKIDKAADDGVFGGGEVYGNVGWGFSQLHYDYEPVHPDTRLRGLNIVREKDGSVIINALQVFGIDGLDPDDRARAIEIGKAETEPIVEFLRAHFPGFENAEIVQYPTELYVRETRHIEAEYQLPLSDVWENKDHWDSIGFGSYPVDVQATSANDYGYVYGRPVQYAIPFRSLVPLEIDGLLVASKASGYSSLAAASSRVIPTGMTAGQAAGVAAAISIENDMSFRDMTKNEELIKEMQTILVEQGNAKLYPFDIEYPYEGEWFYPAARTLLNYGLILGGYDNVFPVEKPISELSFANLLSNGVQRVGTAEAEELIPNLEDMRELIKADTELERDKAAEMVLALHGIDAVGDPWQQAVDAGLIDQMIVEKVTENRVLNGAEGYYIAGAILQSVEE